MIILYVKTQTDTGLKYFGKTTRDPFKYKGSGLYWNRHLKKYGNKVITAVVAVFEDAALCEQFATKFSIDNDIVNSPECANMKVENGKDGAPEGNIVSEETRNKISRSLVGKKSPKTKYEIKDLEKTSSLRSDQMKGRIWINNGVEENRILCEDFLESGWSYGRLKTDSLGDRSLGKRNSSGDNTRGKVIFNNGENHRFFFLGSEPEGWYRGKIPNCQNDTNDIKSKIFKKDIV
jgi:hypothetical protein